MPKGDQILKYLKKMFLFFWETKVFGEKQWQWFGITHSFLCPHVWHCIFLKIQQFKIQNVSDEWKTFDIHRTAYFLKL